MSSYIRNGVKNAALQDCVAAKNYCWRRKALTALKLVVF
jgi:hypothetical protein